MRALQNNPIDLKYLHKLKIRTVWSQKKMKTKENLCFKPCMRSKTIQLIKNIWTRSTFQLLRARFFQHWRKHSANHFCLTNQSKWSIIFGQAQNSNCFQQELSITKQNRQCKLCVSNKTIQLIKNICTSWKFQAQNFNCLKQEISVVKEHRNCKPCVPKETIQLIKNSWAS